MLCISSIDFHSPTGMLKLYSLKFGLPKTLTRSPHAGCPCPGRLWFHSTQLGAEHTEAVAAAGQRAVLESADRGVQLVGLGGGYPAAPIPSIMTYLIPPFVTTSPTLYTFPLSYGRGLHRFAEGKGLQFVGLGGGYPAAPIPSFMI
jgi:hypothetical protein